MKNNTSPPTFLYRFNLYIIALVLCSYGVYTKVGGLTLRFEKVLILVLFLVCGVLLLKRGGRLRYTRADIYLAAWLVISLISSLLSASPLEAVKSTVDLGLSVSIFFIASTWRVERAMLSGSRAILSVGALLGVGSVLVAALYVSGLIDNVPLLSDFVMVDRKIARIKMTMHEANLFGAVMMVFALISIAEFRRSSLWSWFWMIFCHAGLLLAFSRGPFLGYVIGLLLYCHLLGYKKIKIILFVVAITVLVLATFKVGDTEENKFDENALTRTSTLLPRILTFQYAKEDILRAPVLGSGTYSIDFLHPGALKFVGTYDEKMWISNLPAAILHDSGLIGFAAFSLFLINIFRNGCRSIRQMPNKYRKAPAMRRMVVWLGIGVGILVVSLSTSAYSLGAFWMIMAMVASIPKTCRRRVSTELEARCFSPCPRVHRRPV